MAYAKNSRRGVPRSGGLGDEIPHFFLIFLRKRRNIFGVGFYWFICWYGVFSC